MPLLRVRYVALCVCAVSFVCPVWAHEDDPKALHRLPPVQAPAWRADVDGGTGTAGGFDASGMTLMSWLPLSSLDAGAQSGSDCWGYVSPSGREYAIIGVSSGTAFVEVTNPGNAQVVGFVAGPISLWRDNVVYQNYAYSVSEGGSGIQVIDLSNIDNGVVTHVRNVTSGGTTATHTAWVDPVSGYLYRCGGGDNGLRIYSLANPATPSFVASWSDRYVHEALIVTYTEGPYAGRQIAFMCTGYDGGFTETGFEIVDVTDKQNLVNLARLFYPNPGYSHQCWLSWDRKYVYLNDELDENGAFPSTEHIIDVSDIENPVYMTSFTNGNSAVTHNLYMLNNLMFASNYRSGLRVHNCSDPLQPKEIAYFDTFPSNDGAEFNGNWGNFPYFPSGTIVASDLERGLFVLTLQAAPLGILLPNGAPTTLESSPTTVQVRVLEQFGGQLLGGSPTLHIDDGSGYSSVPLTPLSGDLYEATLPGGDCGLAVDYYFSATATNGITVYAPGGAPAQVFSAEVPPIFTIDLLVDMETNPDWTVGAAGDNATTGIWTRVNPNGTAAQPEDDHTPNPGVNCWVTGQGSVGGGVGDNDVDGGKTTLITSTYDLSGIADPYLGYWRWYSNDQGGAPNNDTFVVDISNDNGSTWTNLETVGPSGPGTGGGWIFHGVRVADVIPPTSQVRLRFIAQDQGSGSIVEAAIDDLQVYEVDCSSGTPCLGDIDGSGTIDLGDLSILLAHFGLSGSEEEGDLNGDSVIDLADLSALLAVFGTDCP